MSGTLYAQLLLIISTYLLFNKQDSYWLKPYQLIILESLAFPIKDLQIMLLSKVWSVFVVIVHLNEFN